VRLLDWLTRRRREDDLQDEIRAHLSMAIADRVRDGEDAKTARLAALKEFGNVTLTRERTRQAWAGGWRVWLLDLSQDVRYSFRLLRRSPGYTLVVLTVLALGIGANISVFRLFRPLALAPIPGVKNSARLGVMVAETTAGRFTPLSHPDLRDLMRVQDSFSAISGTSMDDYSLGLGSGGERIWAEVVTGNYFEVLDVRAQLGRTLLPADDITPGGHPVIVISDGLWKRAFGGDPGVLGRTVRVSGYPFTVVGVTEPAFHGSIVSMDVEAFLPIMMQPQLQGRDELSSRLIPRLWGLGRLKPGVSIDAAAAQSAVLFQRLASLHPRGDVSQRATVIPMWRSPFGAQTYLLPAVALLGAMGVLVLFIVCANVSNLVLVRGLGRRGEIAARIALGASRARVVRLLSIESLSLAVPGALAGLLASHGLGWLMNLGGQAGAPGPAGRQFLDASIDGLVVAFALILSCGCALVFGLLPAFRVSRVDLASIMRDDLSPRTSSSAYTRNALVIAQVAVSLVLLVGAGLVVRSLASARRADPGFDARNVVSLALDLQSSGYDDARGHAFFVSALDALRVEPGVVSVALAANTPMSLVPGRSREFEIEGYAARKNEDLRFLVNIVSPDYFGTLRIPILAGRQMSATDDRSSRSVAIVNETLARRFWRSPQDALGKRLRSPGGDWMVVAGVARDVKYLRLDEEPRPFVYLPYQQLPLAPMFVHVRSTSDAQTAIPRLRARIQSMDANLPILDARPLREQTELGMSILTITAGVLVVIGLVAALLAALGTYGMVSYSARQSEHEIGIRVAVGANRADVVRQFLVRGLRLGAIGTVVGVVGAAALSRALVSLLYGVSATDLVSFSAASAAVMIVVAAASLIPAWRASRTDPIAALRHR
jgi:putative ABC transport system permease protein